VERERELASETKLGVEGQGIWKKGEKSEEER
jgi:hypothetical protein